MLASNKTYLQSNAAYLLDWIQSSDFLPEIELIDGKRCVMQSGTFLYEDLDALLFDNFKQFLESPDVISSAVPCHSTDAQLKLDQLVFSNCSKIIGSRKEEYMSTLPILHKSHSPVAQNNHTLLLLGFLNVYPVFCSLRDGIFPKSFNRIAIVESSPVDLCLALNLFDFTEFIELCRQYGIALDLMVDETYSALETRIAKYFISEHPLSLLGTCILSTPKPSPSLMKLSSWLHAPDGLRPQVEAMLGFPADEINQFFQSFWSALTFPNMSLLTCSDPGTHTICVIASGPSLDDHIDWLKSNADNLYILAAGSSFLSLLTAGVKPNGVVLLERNDDVYLELSKLALDNFNFDGIDLFASSTLDPRVLSFFDDIYQFHRPQSLTSNLYLDERSAFLPQAGPHVVNAAVEVSMFLGAENLILVGCDFGTTIRTKPRSSYAYDRNTRLINLALAGSKGKTVYSEAGLVFSAQLFDSILSYSAISAYRLGDGLPLESVIESTIEDLPNHLFATNNISSVNHILHSFPKASRTTDKLTSVVTKFAEEFKYSIDSIRDIVMAHNSWSTSFENDITYFVARINRSYDSSSMFSVDLLAQPLYCMLAILYSSHNWSNLKEPFVKSLDVMHSSTIVYLDSLKEYSKMTSISRQWEPSLVQSRINLLSKNLFAASP